MTRGLADPALAIAFARRLSALAAVVTIGVLSSNTGHAAQLVWSGDFEEGLASIDGSTDAELDKHIYDEGSNAAFDVQKIGGMGTCGAPRAGVFAGRSRILEGGAGERVRSQVMTHMPGRFHFLWDGPEYWAGVSLCLAQWPQGSDAHTFFHLHAPNEGKGATCDFAGNALTVGVKGDTGEIWVIDNPSGVSEGGGSDSNNKTIYQYSLRDTLGKWQDFVFRFHLSTKGDGYTTVWHNGKQVASVSGLVNVNWKDSCGNVIEKKYHNGLHLGIYGGPNYAGPKTIYTDAAKIAVGTNGYDLVAPGNLVEAAPNPPASLTVQ